MTSTSNSKAPHITRGQLFKGYALGIIGSASYGLNPLFALPLYQHGFTPDNVLFYRYFFAIILLAILMQYRHQSFTLKRNEILPLFVMGILFSFSSLFLFMSYNYLDAGIASTLLFLYPIFVALISAAIFHEKLSIVTIIAIAVAFYGITLLNDNGLGRSLSLTGIGLVALSALSYAIYLVAVNRSVLKTMPTEKLTFYSILFGISIYLVRLNLLTDLQPLNEPITWICVCGLALMPTVVSLVTITASIHLIGSTPASILGALEPVTALVCGVLVFGEILTPLNILGILMVLSAVTTIVTVRPISRFLRYEHLQHKRKKLKTKQLASD